MKEIEILVELFSDIGDCKKILSKFEFIESVHTKDIYFYDPKRDNLKPDKSYRLSECLRLRNKGNRNYITYKKDYFEEEKWIYSDEFETNIGDFDTLVKILNLLGYKKLVEINNIKTIYKSNKYEISLEEVSNLGNFIEVEFCTNGDIDVKKIKKDIQSFINELGIDVSEELNMGKPEMFIRKNNLNYDK